MVVVQPRIEVLERIALKYKVDPFVVRTVTQCESSGSTTIQSNYYYKGKRERSFGIAQINLDWNPDVTYEQAIDPIFSLEFLASHLAKAQGYLWTCWRDNFGNKKN